MTRKCGLILTFLASPDLVSTMAQAAGCSLGVSLIEVSAKNGDYLYTYPGWDLFAKCLIIPAKNRNYFAHAHPACAESSAFGVSNSRK
ncbi:hypothetical protein C8R45DRAFT_1009652 [Mycena sanguinolenta]|nr:hypothetical protein C8R45DRAFT_1009652 [Mycena sanguinolenta]